MPIERAKLTAQGPRSRNRVRRSNARRRWNWDTNVNVEYEDTEDLEDDGKLIGRFFGDCCCLKP